MFARLFDLPVGRMCFGRFPDLRAVPGWLACIAEGGAPAQLFLRQCLVRPGKILLKLATAGIEVQVVGLAFS